MNIGREQVIKVMEACKKNVERYIRDVELTLLLANLAYALFHHFSKEENTIFLFLRKSLAE